MRANNIIIVAVLLILALGSLYFLTDTNSPGTGSAVWMLQKQETGGNWQPPEPTVLDQNKTVSP